MYNKFPNFVKKFFDWILNSGFDEFIKIYGDNISDWNIKRIDFLLENFEKMIFFSKILKNDFLDEKIWNFHFSWKLKILIFLGKMEFRCEKSVFFSKRGEMMDDGYVMVGRVIKVVRMKVFDDYGMKWVDFLKFGLGGWRWKTSQNLGPGYKVVGVRWIARVWIDAKLYKTNGNGS